MPMQATDQGGNRRRGWDWKNERGAPVAELTMRPMPPSARDPAPPASLGILSPQLLVVDEPVGIEINPNNTISQANAVLIPCVVRKDHAEDGLFRQAGRADAHIRSLPPASGQKSRPAKHIDPLISPRRVARTGCQRHFNLPIRPDLQTPGTAPTSCRFATPSTMAIHAGSMPSVS